MVQIKEAGQCHQATRADIFPEVLIFEENAIRILPGNIFSQTCL